MPTRSPGARSARAHTLLLPLLLCGACAAPAPRPLEPDELAEAVGARGVDPAALEQALEAARLEPLGLPAPRRPAERDGQDPAQGADRHGTWHLFAFAYEARTRAARHALVAARAAARGAGAPMPARAMLEIDELEQPDAFARMSLTFDLLGILGLGPAAAARELADADVRRALGELELAVWDARVEVDRARARLAAARAELDSLRRLAGEAGAARARIELLEHHGRVSRQALAAAELAEQRLMQRIRELEGEEARARGALALAAGIAGESPWLEALGPATLADLEARSAPEGGGDPQAIPSRAELLARSPALRVGLLDYALAEARVREVAARRWPTLELGPHLLWRADELLIGLAAGTQIPWPGSVEGPLAAALEEREAARAALEDALLAVEAAARAAHGRQAAARQGHDVHARRVEAETAALWRAARLRFQVEPAALMEWASALAMRAEALSGLQRARLAAIEAALDLERAVGPAPAPVEAAGGLAHSEEPR